MEFLVYGGWRRRGGGRKEEEGTEVGFWRYLSPTDRCISAFVLGDVFFAWKM
jgi:hypothetical protein